jgi:hypothetical protein
MGDPNYVYRPLSKERRDRMRATSLRNRGIPKGHHSVYGVNVPDGIHAEVAKIAHTVKRRSPNIDMEALQFLIKVLVRCRPLLEVENRKLLLIALAFTQL